jgi:hypothetical protein
VDQGGSTLTFSAASGACLQRTDPAGNTLSVIGYLSNSFNFTEVQRTDSAPDTTNVESFTHSWHDRARAQLMLGSFHSRRHVSSCRAECPPHAADGSGDRLQSNSARRA